MEKKETIYTMTEETAEEYNSLFENGEIENLILDCITAVEEEESYN